MSSSIRDTKQYEKITFHESTLNVCWATIKDVYKDVS